MHLRPVTAADMDILFYWRNDKLTRRNSRYTNPITWSGHVQWIERALIDPDIKLLICDDGVPVGLVEFYHEDGLELGWTVAPDHRGQGIGKAMVALALKATSRSIWAEIRKSNKASNRIASGLGFVATDRKPFCKDFVIWVYP